MKTLLIESATEKSALILAQEGAPVASRFLVGGPTFSRTIAQEVKELLDLYSFQPERVVVGQGPGSYTGLRVGASLGKALAYGWNVPVFSLGSLEGFAPSSDGLFAVLVDARSGGFFTLFGEKRGEAIDFQAPFLMKENEALKTLEGVIHIASPHPVLIQNRLKSDLFFDKIWFETAPDPVLLSRLIFDNRISPFELTYCASP